MVLYFSDNKETERKRKGVFYEETLPENAVIFGSTILKKYNGGPAEKELWTIHSSFSFIIQIPFFCIYLLFLYNHF